MNYVSIETEEDCRKAEARMEELENIESSRTLTVEEDNEYGNLLWHHTNYERRTKVVELPHPISAIRIEIEEKELGEERKLKAKEYDEVFGSKKAYKQLLEGELMLDLVLIQKIHKAFNLSYEVLCQEYTMPDPLHKDYGKR